MALPTVAHNPADTVYGGRSFLVFQAPGDPAPAAVEIISKLVNYTGESELAKRMVPDAKGRMRPDRIVQKSAEEAFMFETEEIKKVNTLLGSMNGLVKGTATVYITDPDDASGKVKIKTDTFPCIIERDGGVDFQDDFAKAKIKVTSTKVGDVTFTFDGDA